MLLRSLTVVTELTVRYRVSGLTEAERRKNAHEVEQARSRCAAQLAFLEELRPWADRYHMWSSGDVRRFEVGTVPGKVSATLYFSEDGVVEVLWYAPGNSYESSVGWLLPDNVRLWNWLSCLSTTTLLVLANETAWLRGHGKHTAG